MRAFAKDLRKTDNIASVLELRNGKKPTSNEQMTALSSDGQRATIPHNYQGRLSFTSVSFSADEDEGINAS